MHNQSEFHLYIQYNNDQLNIMGTKYHVSKLVIIFLEITIPLGCNDTIIIIIIISPVMMLSDVIFLAFGLRIDHIGPK